MPENACCFKSTNLTYRTRKVCVCALVCVCVCISRVVSSCPFMCCKFVFFKCTFKSARTHHHHLCEMLMMGDALLLSGNKTRAVHTQTPIIVCYVMCIIDTRHGWNLMRRMQADSFSKQQRVERMHIFAPFKQPTNNHR